MAEDTDLSCFEKARAKGEPTFTARAQDISADLVVDFWTILQRRIDLALSDGMTLEQAVQSVRESFGIAKYAPVWEDAKLNGASTIAAAMRAWPDRKRAD